MLTITPNFVFQHVRQHRLHGVERALEIEIEGAFEQVVVDVEKFRPAQGRTRRVEQELHASEAVDRQLHHVVDRRAPGHVDGERQRLGALGGHLLHGRLHAGLVDVGADQIGALAREDQRGGAAPVMRMVFLAK